MASVNQQNREFQIGMIEFSAPGFNLAMTFNSMKTCGPQNVFFFPRHLGSYDNMDDNMERPVPELSGVLAAWT